MTQPVATTTLSMSVGMAMTQFGQTVTAAVNDATALNRVVWGLGGGVDYGRYSTAENPLVAFVSSATTVAAMIAQGNTLRQAVQTAITTAITDASAAPKNFASDVAAVTEALRSACANPLDALRLLNILAGFEAVVPLANSPAFIADPVGQEIINLTELAEVLMRRMAAISLARAAATYNPLSYQDAIRVRNLVNDALEAVIDEAADNFDDTAYLALEALRVAVVNDLNARGATLAPIVTRRFGATQSSLALAYRLYQDATRAGEIVARNDPPHPNFLPSTLELLAA